MESRSKFNKDGSLKIEEFETEAEKQLRILLRKQINTNTNLQNEFSNRKEFVGASTHHASTEKFRGQVSFEEFSKLDDHDREYESLKQCGLTENEIRLKLGNKSKRKTIVNPEIRNEQLKNIDSQISKKLKTLDAPDTFSGKRHLGRHEMDLEISLMGKLDNGKAQVYKAFTTVAKEHDRDAAPVSARHPMFRIKALAEDLIKTKTSGEDIGEKNNQSCENDSSDDECSVVKNKSLPAHEFIGPVKHIPTEDIKSNRISLEEIKNLPRFKDYKPGEKSNILYLKNLPSNISEADLVSLFVRFQKKAVNSPKILYRLLRGRMKGQAFVTFDNAETATEAMLLVNGYKLNSRPIIIQYGKGKI
ncbi:RNA-binding protein 41-like [Tubulanus polymorphus]|uniref:RNA-binding protein 41-like n=1 Tax=Tubulanus polymorphus TaxID=672921 RepID=UPI003DA325C1